jgi:hypothetical protein
MTIHVNATRGRPMQASCRRIFSRRCRRHGFRSQSRQSGNRNITLAPLLEPTEFKGINDEIIHSWPKLENLR